MSRPLTIAIVGGGAAGTLAAIHVAAHPSATPRRIVVVDPAVALGMGAAYGTRSPSHLLNVRASGMSAFPDDPGHFLAWAQGVGIECQGTDFLPRMHYGRYLRDTLATVLAARSEVVVEHHRARVDSLAEGAGGAGGGWSLTLDDGALLVADHVLLATGNALTSFPGAPAHPAVISDPWSGEGVAGIGDTADVLIVGTGLTAVDVVLTLRDQGHTGTVRMVSSHGLLPEAHIPGPLPPAPPFVTSGTQAGWSVRAGLAAARAAAANADDWRQVVDGLRPQTLALWRGLSAVEQRRFLRHLARRWDVRRHRMAPQVAAALRDASERGRLIVERGRVAGLVPEGDRIRATWKTASTTRDTTVDAVVLCVGPSADPRHDPLLTTLLDAGLATRHPLGLGLGVDAHGRLVGPDGTIRPGVLALGSLRKGAEWESTAVPELRSHARDAAVTILGTAPMA